MVVRNAQRDTIFIQQIQYIIPIPAPMTKLDCMASLRRKQLQEGGEARAVLFELWEKLKQNQRVDAPHLIVGPRQRLPGSRGRGASPRWCQNGVVDRPSVMCFRRTIHWSDRLIFCMIVPHSSDSRCASAAAISTRCDIHS